MSLDTAGTAGAAERVSVALEPRSDGRPVAGTADTAPPFAADPAAGAAGTAGLVAVALDTGSEAAAAEPAAAGATSTDVPTVVNAGTEDTLRFAAFRRR